MSSHVSRRARVFVYWSCLQVSPIMTRQQSYVVLDNSSLTEKQEALIRQTAEVLFVSLSEAGCLLRHYG